MIDNVVSMPPRLERLAAKLKGYLNRDSANRPDWIEIQMGICATLVEARDEFPDNIGFGQWCDANGFGESVISRNIRSAAIAMGREPEALRQCLEATERRSLETIHKFEFIRFQNILKTTDGKPAPGRKHQDRETPQMEAARAAVREAVAAGNAVRSKEIAAELGISSSTVERAALRERARLEGLREVKPLDPAEMTPSMRERFDATLRAALKRQKEEVRAEVRAELYADFEEYDLKHYRKKCEDAERILASHKGMISRKEYRIILGALHPDHNSFSQARDAFDIFKALETVLVKPDAPVLRGPPLPTTVEELRAGRKPPTQRGRPS